MADISPARSQAAAQALRPEKRLRRPRERGSRDLGLDAEPEPKYGFKKSAAATEAALRRRGTNDNVRSSPRGSQKGKSDGGVRAPDDYESCDLEVEAALREADLALAEAEMIRVSHRDRMRMPDLVDKRSPKANLLVVSKPLPILL